MNPTPTSIRVACHVRKASLVAPVDSTLRSLDRLEDEGVIDEFTVSAWPGEVRLTDDPPHGDVVETFEEFDAWAEQWNVSIRPPFTVETRTSQITGESRDVLITPVQCLAIYVNGVLVEVFPHSSDRRGEGETYTILDALSLLEEREIQAFGAGRTSEPTSGRTSEPTSGRTSEPTSGRTSEPTPGRASEPTSGRRPTADVDAADADRCPACGTRFVTGQGVYACPDCDWTGIATGPGQYRAIPVDERPDHSRPSPRTGNEDSPTSGGRR